MVDAIDMEHFLSSLRSAPNVVYVTNPGNGGDNLIGCAALQLLRKLNVSFEFGAFNRIYQDKVLLYAGGGNFVPMYPHFKHFLGNNVSGRGNRIVLLPHTVYGCDKILSELPNNVAIICREPVSYGYVSKHMTHKGNALLAHDMAFHLDLMELGIELRKGTKDTLHAFRTDVETNPNLMVPNDNIDVSNLFNRGTHTPELLDTVTKDFLDFLNDYNTVKTNRLHVAIGAAILGKRVCFYNNSYFKCKAIFEFSLKQRYPGVEFIDD